MSAFHIVSIPHCRRPLLHQNSIAAVNGNSLPVSSSDGLIAYDHLSARI